MFKKKKTANPDTEEAGTSKEKVTETVRSQKELATLCSVIIFVSKCDQIFRKTLQFFSCFEIVSDFLLLLLFFLRIRCLSFLITNEDFVFCLGCVMSI